MSKANPIDLKYTREHEWVKDNGDGTATVGITDHAQEMLTDIVFVELPAMGKKCEQSKQIATVESVKSVSDVYSPVNGEVIEVNKNLETQPDLINKDAFGNGWIAKVKLSQPTGMDTLMDAAAYTAFCQESSH